MKMFFVFDAFMKHIFVKQCIYVMQIYVHLNVWIGDTLFDTLTLCGSKIAVHSISFWYGTYKMLMVL